MLAEVIELNDIRLSTEMLDLREEAIRLSGSEDAHEKKYPIYNWQRLQFTADLLSAGDSILDVGPGRGHMCNYLLRSGMFENVCAIDIVNPNSHLDRRVNFEKRSVLELKVSDTRFISVLALEILEHLDPTQVSEALRGLRRSASRDLIATVPFCEPMPSKYHMQTFDTKLVETFFPSARKIVMLKRPVTRVPWILVHEML